ncbi:MAG: septum formation protein Maf [Alkaliphilus sp.]|nr:septum formation protein Maf [Alkaliphilus sp.]
MTVFVLASASPRRSEILSIFTEKFEIQSADIEEKIHAEEYPEQIVMALALEKALTVAEKRVSEEIIIAADTVVVRDQIFGKPIDYEDAFRMLSILQNQVHEVLTGVAIIKAGTNEKIVSYSKTKVKMKQLSEQLIHRYINTGEVWGKAGAYAIQGKGAGIVEWIEGDYFNVVGLPISKLVDLLRKHFKIEIL